MTGAIFISYRRGESLVEARAVYERLSRDFRGRVFIDLEGIDFGDDFVETLQRQLAGCQVMLALIGPGWLGAAQGDGRRAIDDEKDFVHIELATAFAHGVRVVPVLLNGAALPDGGIFHHRCSRCCDARPWCSTSGVSTLMPAGLPALCGGCSKAGHPHQAVAAGSD